MGKWVGVQKFQDESKTQEQGRYEQTNKLVEIFLLLIFEIIKPYTCTIKNIVAKEVLE